jgi:hypothetical protein
MYIGHKELCTEQQLRFKRISNKIKETKRELINLVGAEVGAQPKVLLQAVLLFVLR